MGKPGVRNNRDSSLQQVLGVVEHKTQRPNATTEKHGNTSPLTAVHKEYQCDSSLRWACQVNVSQPKGKSKNITHSLTLPTQTPAKTQNIDFLCHSDPRSNMYVGQQSTYVQSTRPFLTECVNGTNS